LGIEISLNKLGFILEFSESNGLRGLMEKNVTKFFKIYKSYQLLSFEIRGKIKNYVTTHQKKYF
jgi:hypothetical protein